ncbi:unannotated protein [freshwater metagenome]|uniref:Unannotated protein n=1 Tax=freshwater metagenome TaxID=449393 RepID=A0A6J7JCH3_9ZZZZ
MFIGRRGRGCAVDDKHDLAARLIGGPLDCVGQRAAPHLFVKLGELASDGDATCRSERVCKIGERASDTMRSLVAHDSSRLASEFQQALIASHALARQEPFEYEPCRR